MTTSILKWQTQNFCKRKTPRGSSSTYSSHLKFYGTSKNTVVKKKNTNSNCNATIKLSQYFLDFTISSSSSSTKTKRARTMARLINTGRWSARLETSLSALAQPTLTQTTVLHTLRLIATSPKALHFFYWAHKSGFTHTPQSYFLMLEILCKTRNLNTARRFLFSIHKKSNGAVKLDDKHFNCLIWAFGEAGLFKESLKVFRTMKCIGVSPSVYTFNNLFVILLKRGRTGIVFELYDEMLKTFGVKPNLYTFNILLKGFCRNSMVDEGFRLFKEIESFKCEPDVITYNTIVDGLCRAGKVKTAHNVMNGMLKRGSNLSPNLVTYTTLIRGYCQKQETDEALSVLEEMVDRGLEPNQITYNTLIQGLCEARRFEKNKRGFGKCSSGSGGFVPDTCTFTTLINAHCNEGNLAEGMKIFEKMLEWKVQPDSAAYSILIRSFCDKGDFEKAEKLFQELFEKEVLLCDDGCALLVASYNPIFKYLCENGKTEMAERVLRQLMKSGTQDASAFKTLIMGHCMEGTSKAGHELLVLMLRRDFVPDVETYESLIEGLLQSGEPILAHDTLEKMLKSSYLPRTSTFHFLLIELVKKDCAHESYSLMMLMIEKKIRQNINISTDAVRMLLKSGVRDKAFEIVRGLYEKGFTIKMEEVISFLCKQRKLLEARELMLFNAKNGQRVDLGVCSIVLIGLCKIQRLREAFELYYELLEQGVQQPLSCLEDLRAALEAEGRSKEAEFVSKRMLKQLPVDASASKSRVKQRSPYL